MYSNEHTLQDLLVQVYHQMDMDDTLCEMEVTRAYNSIVGDLISKLTRQLKYEDGVLFAKIASPALRNELSFKRESLKERINTHLGRNIVKEIKFC